MLSSHTFIKLYLEGLSSDFRNYLIWVTMLIFFTSWKSMNRGEGIWTRITLFFRASMAHFHFKCIVKWFSIFLHFFFAIIPLNWFLHSFPQHVSPISVTRSRPTKATNISLNWSALLRWRYFSSAQKL